MAKDVTATGRVRVFQEYMVQASGLQNSFDYEIVPSEADAPVARVASGAAVTEFSLRRDQELWLEFDEKAKVSPLANQLVYHYILQPKETTLSDGLYYVDFQSENLVAGVNVYYLELYVQCSSVSADGMVVTPIVHVDGWDGPKVTDPGWRIAYDENAAEPVNPVEPENPDNSKKPGESGGGGPLSKTGEAHDARLVLGCVVYGLALLLAGLSLRHRRAGECDA